MRNKAQQLTAWFVSQLGAFIYRKTCVDLGKWWEVMPEGEGRWVLKYSDGREATRKQWGWPPQVIAHLQSPSKSRG